MIRSNRVHASDAVRKWYGGVWFAPNRLKKAALTDTVKGMYLPYWTFDSRVHCGWEAEAGYYYYTTESYTDNNGESQTRGGALAMDRNATREDDKDGDEPQQDRLVYLASRVAQSHARDSNASRTSGSTPENYFLFR